MNNSNYHPGSHTHTSDLPLEYGFLADHFQHNLNIIDLLKTAPSKQSFSQRVQHLGLSSTLERKALVATDLSHNKNSSIRLHLSEHEEKELATEVLLLRHRFTELVFENREFRQAALTVIQNIYLFRQRKIFFGTGEGRGETERQKALLLFSRPPHKATITLAQTFQHLMVARAWNRIVSNATDELLRGRAFEKLHSVVEKLNTLRNIYMILSTGLVGKLTANISAIYRQSISSEDARQIGSFGIARAAYRYHPSCGMRFSTYASYWILREIQRQALEGRLIRISAHLVENFAREAKEAYPPELGKSGYKICQATAQLFPDQQGAGPDMQSSPSYDPEECCEKQQLQKILLETITTELSPKCQDVLERRYGLGVYRGREHSVVEIARIYGVTRGSIYQLEASALQKLRKAMAKV